MQYRIAAHVVDLLIRANEPTTEYSPERWGSDDWRERYMEVSAANRAELARKGDELRLQRKTREPRSA